MVTKLENQEIMTVYGARHKYVNKWFCYVIIEKEDEWMYKPIEEVRVKVIYIADSKKELVNIPEYERIPDGFCSGGIKWGLNVNPEPGIQIGGLEVEWV